MPDIQIDTAEGRIRLLLRRMTPLSPTEMAKLTTDKYGTICAILRRGLQLGVFERRGAYSKYQPKNGWGNKRKPVKVIWVYYLKGDHRNTTKYGFPADSKSMPAEILDSVTHGLQLPET